MSRAQHRRLVLRDEGRRRATVVTRAAGIAGAALAALFGVVFAQQGLAAANQLHANAPVVRPRPAAPTTPAPRTTTTPVPRTTTAPAPRTVAPRTTAASPTTRAPVLQPPAQAPTSAQGGGQGSSGGS